MSSSRRKYETRIPKARDRIEVEVPDKGSHPAVVLHVEPGMMVLAVGSHTLKNDVEVCRVDRYPQLRTMDLDPKYITIFYECHIQPTLWLGAPREIRGKCPPKEFDQLTAAMRKVGAEARAGTRQIDTIPRLMPKMADRFLDLSAPPPAVATPPAASEATTIASAVDLQAMSAPGADDE